MVLFAEAGKDFLDFLFTLLSLPVGTVIRLLSKDGMVGSFGKLYESVESLDCTYMQPQLNKDILLKPKAPVAGPNIFGLLANEPAAGDKILTSKVQSANSTCLLRQLMLVNHRPQSSSGFSAAGYVKGVVTYMIMDDLEVKPMSTISSITLLNRFNATDVGALEEKGVKLLKESLQSKAVLTNVFLGKKAAA
ncbi:hypothetical protein ACLB2K_026238 [Fragaria x ananassa]